MQLQTSSYFQIQGDTEVVLASESYVTPGQLPPQLNAAISLPASLFQIINNSPNLTVGVFFALYDTPILFPVNGGNNRNNDGSIQTEVGSSVLAATVGPDINFQNLIDPITIVLRLQVSDSEERVSQLISPKSKQAVYVNVDVYRRCMSNCCSESHSL